MSSPSVTQQTGYQPEVIAMNEIQRNEWLKTQPGYSDVVQGPPTPFATSIREYTPLYGLEQRYIAAQSNQYEVAINPNSTGKQLKQADLQVYIARNAYNTRVAAIQLNERAIKDQQNQLKNSFNPFKTGDRFFIPHFFQHRRHPLWIRRCFVITDDGPTRAAYTIDTQPRLLCDVSVINND